MAYFHMRRRQVLPSLGAGFGLIATGGCAVLRSQYPALETDLFVALGRTRAVAVLDTVTDQVRTQLSLRSLGKRGHPALLGVDPWGNAVVLPISNYGPRVGIVSRTIQPSRRSITGPVAVHERIDSRYLTEEEVVESAPASASIGPSQTQRTHGGDVRCRWLSVASGGPVAEAFSPLASRKLTTDAFGRAYIIVSDGSGGRPSYVAVVDIRASRVLRHIPVAPRGETVLALAVRPDGALLYASLWSNGLFTGQQSAIGGRLLALDTSDGRIQAEKVLSRDTAAVALTLVPSASTGQWGVSGAGEGGSASDSPTGGWSGRLYAGTVSPGPSVDDHGSMPVSRAALVAVDGATLADVASWPLDAWPTAIAVSPDHARAYLLASPAGANPAQQALLAVDLSTGAAMQPHVHRWPLPQGGFALALTSVGKLYVADGLADRLWRLDLHTNKLAPPLPLPGGPLALASPPS